MATIGHEEAKGTLMDNMKSKGDDGEWTLHGSDRSEGQVHIDQVDVEINQKSAEPDSARRRRGTTST